MKASPLASIFSIAPSAFAGGDEPSPCAVPASLRELEQEVARWGEQYIPAFTADDVEAIAGWLNRNFYRLAQ